MDPASELRLKLAVVALTTPVGPPVIEVADPVRSMVQLCSPGTGSVLPAGSTALTLNT